MVSIEIHTNVSIKCDDQKPIAIPNNLVVHHNGRQWLKVRPTAQCIIHLILGSQIHRNASLTSNPTLQELITKRNHQWSNHTPTENQQNPEQEVFAEGQNGPKAKKRRIVPSNLPEIVQIDINGTKVDCLMQGQRPSSSDLTIAMEKDQLEALVATLRPRAQGSSLQPTRSYNKKPPPKAEGPKDP
eukprot:Skav205938  [mRNA]  locus=scaffold2739:225247:225804:+ [translate_table: standard]